MAVEAILYTIDSKENFLLLISEPFSKKLYPLKYEVNSLMSRRYYFCDHLSVFPFVCSKVKVGVLRPVQQPGSYWDRSSELPLVGLEPTEVTAYD